MTEQEKSYITGIIDGIFDILFDSIIDQWKMLRILDSENASIFLKCVLSDKKNVIIKHMDQLKITESKNQNEI